MPAYRLPVPQKIEDRDKQIKHLCDVMMIYRKELEYLLNNLDDDNIQSLDASKIKNLKVETIVTEMLFADTILSNTTITEVLYANEGRIARLTVDHLLTGDFISGSEYIYFIDARDQYLKFIEGQRRDDLPQVQYTNIDNVLLYWDGLEHNYMTINETDYPVMVYVYDLTTKMEMNFEYDLVSGYNVPKIIFGAGVGNKVYPERGKGYIYKDADGLLLEYIKADGTELSIRLGENGIETNPSTLVFPDAFNDSEVIAPGGQETVLTGIGVSTGQKTRIAFDCQIDVTPSEAMTVLVCARVDNEVHRYATKYFVGPYKDTICFHGLLDSMPIDEHFIDISVKPDVGTATIAAKEYRLMLTVRDGAAKEMEPWPEIKINQASSGIRIDNGITVGLTNTSENPCISSTPPIGSGFVEEYTGVTIDIGISVQLRGVAENFESGLTLV